MKFGTATVSCGVTVQVVIPEEGPRTVPVVMRYDRADPFAVCLDFHAAGGHGVEWVFGRELLSCGLSMPSGEGDVRIWPVSGAEESVCIALLSPDGEALVKVAARSVSGFLGRSYAVCPPGSEADHLDVDGALRSLLAT